MDDKSNVRRRILKAAGLAGTTMLIGAPAIVRAQTREIVVGGPAGTTPVFTNDLFPMLEKKLGIKIFYEGTNSVANLSKLRADRSSPKFSAVIMDDPYMIIAAKDGLIVPVDHAKVPNVQKLVPAALHKDAMWVNYKWPRASAGLYTNSVKSLGSYKEIWEPRFAKKVAIPNIKTTEWPFVFTAAAHVATGKPFKEAQYDLDSAFKALKDLKPNVFNVYANSAQTGTLLESGEIWISFGAFSTYFLSRKAAGAPVDLAAPKEGSFALPNGLAKVKNGPHPDVADAFINEMLGTEAQTLFMEKFFDSPTNGSVPLKPGIVPASQLFSPDWAFVSEKTPEVSARFDREIAV
jgi:putative spermidine/putrescine transport system substrate-binding protein